MKTLFKMILLAIPFTCFSSSEKANFDIVQKIDMQCLILKNKKTEKLSVYLVPKSKILTEDLLSDLVFHCCKPLPLHIVNEYLKIQIGELNELNYGL